MIKRILLGLGATPLSHLAVRRAVTLAQQRAATITAVTVLDMDLWKAALGNVASAGEAARRIESQPWAVARRRLERMIDEFQTACVEARIDGQVIKPQGNPFDELVSQWRYHDLLVFGLRGLFDYSLVPQPEQTIADLIRRGVRPIYAVAGKDRPIRRVLIAYSGSMESAKAMNRYVQMAMWPEAQVHLACFETAEDVGTQLMQDAVAYCRAHGLKPDARLVSEPAIRGLLPHARTVEADLIVLGDSYRSALTSFLLGDVVQHAVRNSDISLFLSH